jgi:hypothetical protein
MAGSAVRYSVVVPTRDGGARLFEVLEALDAQCGAPEFEVVVADDGSTDGTPARVRAAVRGRCAAELPARGPRRRATGCAGERSPFWETTRSAPDWLAEHERGFASRGGGDSIAVLGYTSWHPRLRTTAFLRYLNEEGLQFGYSLIDRPEDVPFQFFYTSNLSLARERLLEEPFDEFPYAAWEDIEASYRLARHGFGLVFSLGAGAHSTDRLTGSASVKSALDTARSSSGSGTRLAGFLGIGPDGPPTLLRGRQREAWSAPCSRSPCDAAALVRSVRFHYIRVSSAHGASDRDRRWAVSLESDVAALLVQLLQRPRRGDGRVPDQTGVAVRRRPGRRVVGRAVAAAAPPGSAPAPGRGITGTGTADQAVAGAAMGGGLWRLGRLGRLVGLGSVLERLRLLRPTLGLPGRLSRSDDAPRCARFRRQPGARGDLVDGEPSASPTTTTAFRPTSGWKRTYDVAIYRRATDSRPAVLDLFRPGDRCRDQLEPGEAVHPASSVRSPSRDERLRRDREALEEAQRADDYDDSWSPRSERGESFDARGEPARLRLEVAPDDASVYLDGRFLGTGRDLARLRAGLLVDPGVHTLEVVRPGFQPVRRSIEVGGGSEQSLEVELESGD